MRFRHFTLPSVLSEINCGLQKLSVVRRRWGCDTGDVATGGGERMAATSKTLILAASCNAGLPTAAHFRVEEKPAPTADELADGCVLVRLTHLSADPYMRGRIRADRPGSTAPGAAISGFVAGVVVASRSGAWAAGDFFGANLPFSTVQVLTPAHLAATAMWKLNGLCGSLSSTLAWACWACRALPRGVGSWMC